MRKTFELATSLRSHADVYDINRKTGALILGKNRLDDYAEKYLTEHCPQALKTPMAIPVEELLEASGLRVRLAHLSASSDVFACCVLVDGPVDIYEPSTGELTPVFYKAGTILVDPDSEWSRGRGARRNALMHELLHWEKDRVFFQIHHQRLAGTGPSPAPLKSRTSATFFQPSEKSKRKETELQWLEWQAHRLAPRVLMPKTTFTLAANQMLDTATDPTCSDLVDQLADLFEVSRAAVKYRLKEVGLLPRISQLGDFQAVFSFIRAGRDEYVSLTPVQAAILLWENPRLQQWVRGGDYIFVEGYFVKNSTRYVRLDAQGSFRLKPAAKKNPAKAFLRIDSILTKDYVGLDKDLDGLFHLEYRQGVDKRIIYLDPAQQATPDDYDDQKVYTSAANSLSLALAEDVRLEGIIGNRQLSLCQSVWELLEYKGIRYPATFSERTGLYDAMFNKIKNDKMSTMSKDSLMAICVGLGLNAYALTRLAEKASIHLNRDRMPDGMYLTLLERFPGLSLCDANGILEAQGLAPLGSIDRSR